MTTSDKLVDEITAICFGQLLTHKDAVEPENPIYLNEKDRELNYLGWPDGIPIITEGDAKEKIRQWVIESLNKHGRVTLYTCGDNALISLEAFPEGDLESLQNEPLENGTDKLYIAFD